MHELRNARENTPKRWRAALKRAFSEGVQVRQLQGSGMWIATSASDPNTAYEVTPWECECQAGQFHDPICKHRAALLVKLGRLRVELDAESAETTSCPTCCGTGVQPQTVSTILPEAGQWSSELTCQRCQGSGIISTLNAA